jgi:serine/threonine-protein kinase HipA
VTATDPRQLAIADVYKAGRLAGHLTRTADAVVFDYDEDYLADPTAPAVATTLPRREGPTIGGGAGAVPPFFAGLLPEGRRLSALRREIKTSADDEFSLLVAVGQDTIGDVQVVAAGEEPQADHPELEVDDWSRVDFAELYARMTGESLRFERSGLSGVQVKASARMVTLPAVATERRFILKLEPPEFRHLAANEAFFLRAARRSGLAAADAGVVEDRAGRPALLVERFDRAPRDGGIASLAQEDACQVLGRYPADKYTVTTEDVIEGMSSVAGAPIVAARDLLRQLAFAFLTGNGDAHAKNFSIVRRDGEWRVSPAYDTPSTHPYGDTTMALTLNGKRDERIGREDFVAVGERTGVNRRAVETLLDDLVTRTATWIDGIAELPFDERTGHKLRRSIEYRCRRLER